jgi:hypothetical protein
MFLFQIHAEFQVISPFVPVRQVKFLRLCKQLAEGVWAVADVSVDGNQENLNAQTPVTCRRLPSGCIIQVLNNGCCKVMICIDSSFVLLILMITHSFFILGRTLLGFCNNCNFVFSWHYINLNYVQLHN